MQQDLDAITHDIREAHKKDSTTADTVSPAADAQEKRREAMEYKGSKEEATVRLFLAQLKIKYDSLTKDELTTLIGILKKPKLIKGSDHGHSKSGKG